MGFINHPQRVWARRALFQVHLWAGMAISLYVFVISVSGSAVVFRIELNRALAPVKHVAVAPPRLSESELRERIQATRKGWRVVSVSPSWWADRPTDVIVQRGRFQLYELFDPYTGASLGDAIPREHPIVHWFVELHDNLLGGRTGRWWNGIGSVVVAVLSVTGAVIWWPGSASWRRSLWLRRKVGWKRFTWDLHSATGFWMWLLVALWAVSGVYLAFPGRFNDLVDYFEPIDTARNPRIGDTILFWLPRLHFGRFAGTGIKALWVLLGLTPAVLVVTGAVMWWNRVLSKYLVRLPAEEPQGASANLAIE
jgi:uncharacterized iron-regulated membrane protein